MTRRGWCPSVFTPMPADDGLLVRVKPTASQFSAAQVAGLAEAAARDGNGKVQLTNRANLQLRGFTAASAERFAQTMIDLGLASPDPRVEAVRNVMCSPLAGADPDAIDTRAYAIALETLLVDQPALQELPPKFGFAVDSGGLAVLPRSADILVTVQDDHAFVGLPDSPVAHRTAASPAAVAAAARALAETFLAKDEPRMRYLVEDLGGEQVFALAGLAADRFAPPQPFALPVGFTGYGDGQGCFTAALEFGQCDAPVLLSLAEMADRHADGRIAATPWRAYVLPLAREPGTVAKTLAAAGFIVNSADPRVVTTEAGALEGVAELLR